MTNEQSETELDRQRVFNVRRLTRDVELLLVSMACTGDAIRAKMWTIRRELLLLTEENDG